jgi:hypothetical protein
MAKSVAAVEHELHAAFAAHQRLGEEAVGVAAVGQAVEPRGRPPVAVVIELDVQVDVAGAAALPRA